LEFWNCSVRFEYDFIHPFCERNAYPNDEVHMTLLDHFRPPLSTRRHWHSFHNSWASNISAQLNQVLPVGYFAEANVQFGIEIDVATMKEQDAESTGREELEAWSPNSPTLTLPWQPAIETVEVQVFSTREGPILAGAIELISPANKDRSNHRTAFVSKCESYLQQGVGLIIVDCVTTLQANLHAQLMQRLGLGAEVGTDLLYAIAYHALEVDGVARIDVWQEALRLETPLPTLPLWLKGGLCIPIHLDATYHRTCVEQRIP
jgi:hypothetical protein